MRRPAMYLAGMFLATGASLALAGPALAHDDDCRKYRGSAAGIIFADDDHGDYHGRYHWVRNNSYDSDYRYTHVNSNNQRTYGLINVLSGNNGAGLIGGGY